MRVAQRRPGGTKGVRYASRNRMVMPTSAKPGRIAEALGPVSAPFSEPVTQDAILNGVWLGQPGVVQFEVCELISTLEPAIATVRAAWRKRRGNRGRPLIVFWQGSNELLLTEPTGEPQVTVLSVSASVALTVIRRALAAPRGEAVAAAMALLERAQGSGGVSGFRNRNLLSTHYVTSGFQRNEPQRWTELTAIGKDLRRDQGARLLRALGYAASSATTFEMMHKGKPRVHAVALPDGTAIDRSVAGPGGSPTTRLLVEANSKGAERAVIISGRVLRIYVADATKGLDDIATASNYIEIDLDILEEASIGLLPMLFAADAHTPGGLFDSLVEQSNRYAIALRGRFRDRVYSNVVGDLARALYAARGRRTVEGALLYQATLRLLYRLLFVLYAEDRNLLPLGNSEYKRVSLTQTLLRLEERSVAKLPFDVRQTTLWDDLFQVFEAIRSGNVEWNVPGYNGGLFEPELDDHPEAAYLNSVKVPNAVLAPILLSLGFDEQDGHRGKVDFGDLGVRHLGTLYEGLLSFSIRVAEVPLTVDADGFFVPAKAKDEPIVAAGELYVTSPKGGRKASGSHYTPTFVVRRLLENALQPVLERHLDDVAKEAPEEQWAAMLAFHVVDPAMGSGHFLVDALDVIANRFAKFLAENPRVDAGPVKAARDQITAIGKEFGIEFLGESIGDFELLRRIVMRNCIYGVDLNPMAVELAKLSLWLHAFVPGLPLSFLGHNLRHGNALVGLVGKEIADKVGGGLFGGAVSAALQEALAHARRLASLSDLSRVEIKRSESAQGALETATTPLMETFDAYACRVFARNDDLSSRSEREMGRASLEFEDGLVRVLERTIKGEQKRQIRKAQEVARSFDAFHWQLAFPEVFLRETPGFDVVLGNPPWDKVLFEEQQFWVSRVPGLNALPAKKRTERIKQLRKSRPLDAEEEELERSRRADLQLYFGDVFVLQGHGHFDLSKLFMERALSLRAESGAVGCVLPGASMVLGGWAKLRRLILSYDVKVTEARNSGGWIFPDAEGRMTVAPISIASSNGEGTVLIVPEINSPHDWELSANLPTVTLAKSDVEALSDTCIVPWLNSSAEVSVLNKIRTRPSVSSGRGWIVGRSESRWDFTGSGRDRTLLAPARNANPWHALMTRHIDQYAIDKSEPFQHVIGKPEALLESNKDIVVSNGQLALGPRHPRIVYRYPARGDDSRTLIATYLPTNGLLPNTGYVHTVNTSESSMVQDLALLGYLNSLTCDWWTRRFVDRHVSAPVLNGIPLPAWSDETIAEVAGIVARLLSNDESFRVEFSTSPYGSDTERASAILVVEKAVADGFDLSREDIRTMLEDFSDTEAVAPKSVLSALRDQGSPG